MTVVVHPSPGVLAQAIAARIAIRLADAQALRGSASVVLTGGTIGIACLEALRTSALVDTVEWSRVDIWWGDERFVAADSPDRNDLQARTALLDHVGVDPARVHPMGALEGFPDVEAAALAYAAELDGVPPFDLVLLGMGPEGHVASIFPDSPAASDPRHVLAVHDCPKPPPTRVSLGFSALQTAREVWLLVAGAEKADAVALALSGTSQLECPAAGAQGMDRTLWLVDEAAASHL